MVKFRVLLILAFAATAFILATNAEQVLWFEKSNAATGTVKTSSVAYKNSLKHYLTAASRFGDPLAIQISADRAISILTNTLPSNSCMESYFMHGNTYATKPFLDLNGTKALAPASTNKIITAAIVLSTLDPNSTLDTSLVADKKVSSLSKAYIRTSGDPSFVTTLTPPARRPKNFSPSHVHTFSDFATKTYAAGIRSISSLVIDNKWFGLAQVEPGWADDKEEVGLIGAFNVDEGFTGTTLAPDVSTNAANALKAAFTAKGITIGTITYSSIPDSLSDASHVIAQTSSSNVVDLVSDALKTSDNVFAEQLLAAATHSTTDLVTKETRAAFVDKAMSALKLDTSDYIFVNGAGYSTLARATCALENQTFHVMRKRGIDLAALSSEGGKDGTLIDRYSDVPGGIHAKTGTMNNITSLTGTIAKDTSFAFLSNAPFTTDGGHALQDTVVSVLNRFPFVKSPVFAN